MSPNEHPISGVDAHIRQRFVEASAATVDSQASARTFLVADLVGFRPNPSSTIPRDNNTGSIYLYRQSQQTEDWTIERTRAIASRWFLDPGQWIYRLHFWESTRDDILR
ncbi:hypothetical protein BDZ89DRAFT_1152591 [Hymenopellis radicata]|nr:hypothetical protein BDZ89DRAFT_1152591 [Hymenopellis radicata]